MSFHWVLILSQLFDLVTHRVFTSRYIFFHEYDDDYHKEDAQESHNIFKDGLKETMREEVDEDHQPFNDQTNKKKQSNEESL